MCCSVIIERMRWTHQRSQQSIDEDELVLHLGSHRPPPRPICQGLSASSRSQRSCDLRERVMSAQVHQPDRCTLVRRELAAAVTLLGDAEHGDPLTQGVRPVECGRIRNQRGLLCLWVETSNTSPNLVIYPVRRGLVPTLW